MVPTFHPSLVPSVRELAGELTSSSSIHLRAHFSLFAIDATFYIGIEYSLSPSEEIEYENGPKADDVIVITPSASVQSEAGS